MEEEDRNSLRKHQRRGYINPRLVKGLAFFVITLCIIISVVASILAIWEFAATDVLWRTVATCLVVAAGMVTFSFSNAAFGDSDDTQR